MAEHGPTNLWATHSDNILQDTLRRASLNSGQLKRNDVRTRIPASHLYHPALHCLICASASTFRGYWLRTEPMASVFVRQVDRRINLTAHIAHAYGDPDPRFMTITRVQPGSVRFSWTNNSLPTDGCPRRQIDELSSRLISPDTGDINPDFRDAMRPYQLLGASATPLGVCTPPPPPSDATTAVSSTTARDEGPVVSGLVGDDSLMLVMIVAACVIAVLLVVLIIIICCLLYTSPSPRDRTRSRMPSSA